MSFFASSSPQKKVKKNNTAVGFFLHGKGSELVMVLLEIRNELSFFFFGL